MKRISSLAISVMAMGLLVAPVKAQTGNVQGLRLNSLVCFNRTTGETAPVTRFDDVGEFDCSSLSAGPNEEVGVLLLGVAGGVGGCVLEEIESDSPQPQDIGILGQECATVTVTGDVHTGYDDFSNSNPNADWDLYALTLAGVSQLRLDVQLTPEGEFAWGVVDADTEESLQCQELTCIVPAQTTRVIVIIGAQSPADYSLTISGGTSGGSQPFGALAHGMQSLNARQLRNIR
jgi:hypothetical protein